MAKPPERKNQSQVAIALPEEARAVNRRQLVAGGISLTAFAPLSGLMGAFPARAQETDFKPKRKLIWMNMGGGWDLLETTDPKPSSTPDIDMVYDWGRANSVAGSSDGTRVGRWLPNIAGLGQDLLVVRGLAMGTTSHSAGSIYMDTGILSNAGEVNAASVPAIVASESEATIPIIQLQGGAEPRTDRGLLNPVSVVRAGNLRLYRSMYPDGKAAIDRRMAVLDYLKSSISRLRDRVGKNDRLESLAAAEDKVRNQFEDNVGAKLALTEEDRAIFEDGAPDGMNRGASDSVALALKLVKNDICSCINLGVGGFDTHSNQTPSLRPLLTNVDFLMGRLVQGLKDAGRLDETLIVMYSDFGRTPKVNGGNGRDHWPTGGCLVIGGGIDGGRSVGVTDDSLNAANLVDPNTGKKTGDEAVGVQLNPTHIGGMVLDLVLGQKYSQYRPYLEAIPALTKVRGG